MLLPVSMLLARELHLSNVIASADTDVLHQPDAAVATAEAAVEKRVVSTSLTAVLRQPLQMVHGVGLQMPVMEAARQRRVAR